MKCPICGSSVAVNKVQFLPGPAVVIRGFCESPCQTVVHTTLTHSPEVVAEMAVEKLRQESAELANIRGRRC